jgi:transcriptional regulator
MALVHTPSLFREVDKSRLHELIDAYGFGVLVAQSQGGGLEISHLPFVLDRDVAPHGRLRFHVARANPIWRAALDGGQVVAIFSGPSAYVSPRWYEHPDEQVPTWNYAVVHAHGRAEGPMQPGELRRLVEDMAAIHERGAARPWCVTDLSEDLVDGLLGGIVGLSIRVDHLEAKFKLSQNRTPEDQRRVADALAARGAPADLELVELMTRPAPVSVESRR